MSDIYTIERARAQVAIKVSELIHTKSYGELLVMTDKVGIEMKRLGKILDGDADATVGELAMIAEVCGRKLKVSFET